jgi:hypothetical protein
VACLVVYLSTGHSEPYASGAIKLGQKHVASALMFAVAALTVCAFMYAAASAGDDPLRLRIIMIPYGSALGVAVLALFYAVALMLFLNEATRPAARTAYWVIVILGPAVVVRFIAGAAFDVWRAQRQTVDSWSPMTVGLGLGALLGVVLYLRVRRGMPAGGTLRSAQEWCLRRPTATGFVALLIAVAFAYIGGVFHTIDVSYLNHPAVPWLAVGLNVAVLGTFAFMCASVLGVLVDEGGRHSRERLTAG